MNSHNDWKVIVVITISETDINPSGNVKASLSEDYSLEIEWTPLSSECFKFSSGIWVRVFLLSGDKHPQSEETYLDVPKECLNTRSNASFTFLLHSSQNVTNERNTCYFELKDNLIECRSYTIEIVPNYQSLKGKPMFTEIVVPSMVEYLRKFFFFGTDIVFPCSTFH